MSKELKAIYEMKREQLMLGWLDSKKRKYINNGYVFAYSVKMYPFFQVNTSEEDVFAELYDIKKGLVSQVVEYVDQKWLDDSKNSELEFYNLETTFGGKSNRAELIQIIRYCAISDRFNDDFFKTVMSNAPVEASRGLDEPLKDDDLSITGH